MELALFIIANDPVFTLATPLFQKNNLHLFSTWTGVFPLNWWSVGQNGKQLVLLKKRNKEQSKWYAGCTF
jgi:hypothetical protein